MFPCLKTLQLRKYQKHSQSELKSTQSMQENMPKIKLDSKEYQRWSGLYNIMIITIHSYLTIKSKISCWLKILQYKFNTLMQEYRMGLFNASTSFNGQSNIFSVILFFLRRYFLSQFNLIFIIMKLSLCVIIFYYF